MCSRGNTLYYSTNLVRHGVWGNVVLALDVKLTAVDVKVVVIDNIIIIGYTFQHRC